TFCDGLQKHVALGMSEKIVDLLEPVEVETENGDKLSGGARCLDFQIELFVESRAVRKPSQRIMMGKKMDVPFGLFPRSQVAYRDGVMRLAGEVDWPLNELDGNYGLPLIPDEIGFDRLILLCKQPVASV